MGGGRSEYCLKRIFTLAPFASAPFRFSFRFWPLFAFFRLLFAYCLKRISTLAHFWPR